MPQVSPSLVLEAFQISKSFPRKTTSGLFYDLFERNTLKKLTQSEARDDESRIQEVSFTIKTGEVLGILGKNGAGKSTLLKILAGIIKPSKGQVTVYRPIVPILDMGVAVHWELNGLSNFFLEGTAQGWTLKDLKKKMPEIIDYSGLNAHLDKPIKYFSSGMLMRLCLSTAFFRDNSLFLLDEAFGAGDAQFREQTVDKILEKSKNGSAFIIVAHNIEMLKKICTRAIYLDEGKVCFEGDVETAVQLYRSK